MAKVIIILIIISLVMVCGGYLFFETLPGFFFESIILLLLSTAGLYRFLVNIKRGKPDFFVPLYLATLTVKLIAYGAYIFVMVKMQPVWMFENVVFFMVAYVLFTVAETYFLHRVVSRP